MSKPIIAIKLNNRDYAGLAALGNRVVANMTGNANFTTPAPALATLTTAIGEAEDAIAVWGPVGNRGSHADLVDLRQKSLTLANLLKAEAHYVQETAQIAAGSDYPVMATIIITSGFELANARTPQGVLEMVQNFHNFISRQLNLNQVKLKWKKPLNTTSAGNVKSYKVMRSATSSFSDATELAVTSKTFYIDTNTTAQTQTWFYWIVPVGAAGDGVTSDVVMVTVPGV